MRTVVRCVVRISGVVVRLARRGLLVRRGWRYSVFLLVYLDRIRIGLLCRGKWLGSVPGMKSMLSDDSVLCRCGSWGV